MSSPNYYSYVFPPREKWSGLEGSEFEFARDLEREERVGGGLGGESEVCEETGRVRTWSLDAAQRRGSRLGPGSTSRGGMGREGGHAGVGSIKKRLHSPNTQIQSLTGYKSNLRSKWFFRWEEVRRDGGSCGHLGLWGGGAGGGGGGGGGVGGRGGGGGGGGTGVIADISLLTPPPPTPPCPHLPPPSRQ